MNEQTSIDVPWDDNSPLDGAGRGLKTRSFVDKVIRLGGIICLLGFIVSIVGAQQIAAQKSFENLAAQAIHKAGLVTMLIGFLVLLAGYRASWRKAAADRMSNRCEPGE
jgi:hypothetical protein